MKSDQVFITIIGDQVQPYGNLTILMETIGSAQKYQTVRKEIIAEGSAMVDGVRIVKEEIIRSKRNNG